MPHRGISRWHIEASQKKSPAKIGAFSKRNLAICRRCHIEASTTVLAGFLDIGISSDTSDRAKKGTYIYMYISYICIYMYVCVYRISSNG